ncbi:hypothetical protein SAMD00019534_036400, partial [Acytostelium subglobosum LB1]|uniref:hypothetical protein n=1 Tax=Acytostelium subglobosum LB1 TaxID=1410327 RepID=UPI000644F53E
TPPLQSINNNDNNGHMQEMLRLVSAKHIESLPISSIRLSTGSNILDRHLQGGILPSGITEIVGEAGSGKTQLCLQLAVQTQLPFDMGGLEGGVLYISSTDISQQMKRLKQIVSHRMPVFEKMRQNANQPPLSIKFEDNLFIRLVPTVYQLMHLLNNGFSELIEKRTIRLLVIDSIATLFRSEYGNDKKDLIDKTNVLWELSNQLKLISEEHGITVVVVNQVSDYFDSHIFKNDSSSSSASIGNASQSDDATATTTTSNALINLDNQSATVVENYQNRPRKKRRKSYIPSFQNTKQQHSTVSLPSTSNQLPNKTTIIPALGLSWANFVNTRIMVKKCVGRSVHSSNGDVTLREMKIVLSSSLPNDTFHFYLDAPGVIGY